MSMKWMVRVMSLLVLSGAVANSVLVPPRSPPNLWLQKVASPGETDLNAVTEERKAYIVQRHNELRASADPPAANMLTMSWNEDLANYAKEWAKCGLPFAHRHNDLGYGENLERLRSLQPLSDIIYNLNYSLSHWWSERTDYNYQDATCTAGKKCGHYTQMAWATTTQVGCAWIMNCPMNISDTVYNFTFLLVCNYKPIGNHRFLNPETNQYENLQPYKEKKTGGNESTVIIKPKPSIWTYGGTAGGANCSFPFTFDNAERNDCIVSISGETAWCKTNNGKWGYCAPEAMREMKPCVDPLPICRRLVTRFMGGRCPDDTHETAYVDYMKDNCPATCGHCDCPVTSCQNGGTLYACVCKCVGGWIGGDCAVCPITECKNGGTFDASTCRCRCAGKYGGVDCGCTDITENFVSRGRNWWRCSLTWLLTKKICGSPFFGPSLREHCPVSCHSCVNPAFQSRQ